MSVPRWVLRTPVLTGASVAAPWLAAVAVTGYRRQARVVGCIAALLSAIASAFFLEGSRRRVFVRDIDVAVFLPHFWRNCAASAP